MTRTALKIFTAALVFGVGLGGCMQMEQETTLFPDGSGKLVMTVGLKKSMIAMIEQMAQQFGAQEGQSTDPFSDVTDPAKLKENAKGIVAWSRPEKKEEGDFVRVKVTGYFEDINKVKVYQTQNSPGQPPERRLAFACKMERTPDGHALTMMNDAGEGLDQLNPGGNAPGGEELAKAMIEQMKPMLKGMKVRFAVTVPGKITKSKGFMEHKDRTATISMNGDTVIALMKDPEGEEAKKIKEFSDAGEGKVFWAEHTVPEAEVTAFKAELEKAKKEWATWLEEAKTEGGKKKDAPKKDF